MKKFLSMLAAMLLLALCPAMAQTLTAPGGECTIEIPEGYFSLNAQTANEMFVTEEAKAEAARTLGLADASELMAYVEQFAERDALVIFDGSLTQMFNLKVTPATMTMEQMVMLQSVLDQQVNRQFVSMGIPEECVEHLGFLEVGGRQWYTNRVELPGMGAQSMVTVVGEYQYTFTFGPESEAVMLPILASLTPVSQEDAQQVMDTYEAVVVPAVDAPTQVLTSPDGSYTVTVPADFIPVNADLIVAISQNEAMQEQMAQILGVEDVSRLAEYITLLETSNVLVVYGSDMFSNFNVSLVSNPLTVEQMITVKHLLDQQLTQQYESVGIPASAVQPMAPQEIGGRQWYAIGVTMGNMRMQQMITTENGTQYTFSFGNIDQQVITSILESFTLVAE